MRSALFAAALVIASASAARAQYGYYGTPYYAAPVVPVVPYGYSYFSSPQLGTFGGGGGYSYFSNSIGTFSTYNPTAYANSVMAQQQAWRTVNQMNQPVQQPRAGYRGYRGW